MLPPMFRSQVIAPFVVTEYTKAAGTVPPPMRRIEIEEACTKAATLAIDRAYDMKLEPSQVVPTVTSDIRLELAYELWSEFPDNPYCQNLLTSAYAEKRKASEFTWFAADKIMRAVQKASKASQLVVTP